MHIVGETPDNGSGKIAAVSLSQEFAATSLNH
jgi:hypothetical protein